MYKIHATILNYTHFQKYHIVSSISLRSTILNVYEIRRQTVTASTYTVYISNLIGLDGWQLFFLSFRDDYFNKQSTSFGSIQR